jgi:hydroxymethylpyrimidine/phosphomethylpyrimidine kinase
VAADTPVALTIAGSDPSGGAGLQADLKTFAAFDVYGAAVVTALTAQDTTGVRAVADVPPAFVAAQLDAVLDDLPVAAAKTGMLGREAVVEAVAERLRARPVARLVVDPVLVATSGHPLLEPGGLAVLRARLLPLATLVTPNLDEAAALTGRRVGTVAEMRDAARALVDLGAGAALVTGGHLDAEATDVLCEGAVVTELSTPHREVPPGLHGAGCALSAAVTAGLARGRPLGEAVAVAKDWVTSAIETAVAVGRGRRPLNHRTPPTPPFAGACPPPGRRL